MNVTRCADVLDVKGITGAIAITAVAVVAGCGSHEPAPPSGPPKVVRPAGFAAFVDPVCPVTAACFLSKLPLASTVQAMRQSLALADRLTVEPMNDHAHLAYEETGTCSGEKLTWMVWTHLAKTQPSPAPPPDQLRRDYLVIVAHG